MEATIEMIPVDKIRPSPFQPRETFAKKEIEELADSIKGSGLIEPILVRKKGDTYEIIAGERRWRAYQYAGLKEIPVIVKRADDIEARELSLVENWHRLALEPHETERFIVGLYEDGIKSGKYTSIEDMASKTGIPQATLQEILLSHGEKKALGITGDTLSYTDLRETRVLKDQPGLRRQVLELREKGKLTRDELREFSKTVIEVSEPVRRALLKENSKLTPEEARLVDVELVNPQKKITAIETLEREKSPDRIRSLIHVIREIEEERPKELEIVKEVDTGDVWICPACNKKFHLVHVDPSKTHKFEEVVE